MKTKIKYETLFMLNKQISHVAKLRKLNCLLSKKNEIKLFDRDQQVVCVKYARINGLWNIDLELRIVSNTGIFNEINLRSIISDKEIKKYEKDFQFQLSVGLLRIRKNFCYKSKAKAETLGIVEIMDSFELATGLTEEMIAKINELMLIKLN